ncbi:DUF2848 family protein [Streptomyces sp. NPDC052042]|uniref:DUF2848 family protein n=1 Tax=Streptomyces sp. NPDC052042 TaxID=3365683 RepID=UPI0037CF08EC
MSLVLQIASTASAEPVTVHQEVTGLYNFGYAGRDTSGIDEHLRELAELGLPAPGAIPALFPLPPGNTTTAPHIVVSGANTYAEVEYVLIKTAEHGWVVTVGSDHSDLEVERVSTPRSKAVCPDVVCADVWLLSDVLGHWDQVNVGLWANEAFASEPLQKGTMVELLAPPQLIEVLEQRIRQTAPVGTVIFSGTIAGTPTPGAAGWSARLHDPVLGRSVEFAYSVHALVDEYLDA